ncbi:RNase H1/viroplasmin domain-containing protein, partial [Paenibacillus validus]|nr:RNase H1/viroplasmin domain-containing protein [Paenibacillus validus]
MAKSKFYVVWEGKQPGVYKTWAECQAQTNGYPQAKFKSYESEEEARKMFVAGWKKAFSTAAKAASSAGGKGGSRASGDAVGADDVGVPDLDSLSVDVG